MSKEFTHNVKNLFSKVVTTLEGNSKHTSSDLLEALSRKVTQPLKTTTEDDTLSLVYDNVSLDIKEDLSSMKVWYTGDYITILKGLQDYDIFQLSEFVLVLERDIPQWKYIWVADEKLRKEKARIADHLKTSLRSIKLDYRYCKDTKSFNFDACRIRFYNLKAKELMLQHGNPFWENKKSEAEILDECNVFHIVPPIENWFEQWTSFMEECEKEKAELERQREEYHNNLMKMRHLINLKQMKLEAFIRSIEFHPSASVRLSKIFDPNKLGATKYGRYYLTLSIDSVSVGLSLKYDIVDQCANTVMENIKRINDLSQELRNTLIDNGPSYFLASEENQFFHSTEVYNPYYIAHVKNGKVVRCEHLSSCRVMNQLNRLVNETRDYINKCEEACA